VAAREDRGVDDLDAVVVGAGFSGLYALHRLRGLGLETCVYEAAAGIGGTWYWNRYPGARCDVESLWYSYSFSEELEQEWEWTERYPAQPEILRYLEHVADRFELRRDICLETRVVRAVYDDDANRWTVETSRGERVRTRYLVMATGCLSTPQLPNVPGLDSFAGETYHTGLWPHEPVSFAGKRVAVIGTGSSAIQSIPVIAREAAQVYVFQRTPNYSVPAHNRPLDAEEQRAVKARYGEVRERMRSSFAGFPHERAERSALDDPPEVRDGVLEDHWRDGGIPFLGSYVDIGLDEGANELVAEFVRRKIRSIVRDRDVAELLCPTDYPIGTKRICVDIEYFETFNRDNVTLADLRRSPLVAITPSGVRTRDAEYDVDALVLATGFDAMTGTLLRIDLRGRAGRALAAAWAHGPTTYLGLQIAGFPNLFTITGPGSPSVLSNMVVSIEQHVNWIADCIAWMRERGFDTIEATPEAEAAWVAHVNEVAAATLFPRASSWYMGANVPGKARVFMPYVGGVDVYRQHCAQVAAKGYEGFSLSREAVGRRVRGLARSQGRPPEAR
jgi:cyclohexanone monooxygenase